MTIHLADVLFVCFQNNEENFKICVNFINSHLKHHRFLSVNSHEVKRDLSGICEKLRFSNLHDIEKKFKKLVDDSLKDPLSVNHYEKDVGYAILSLLTELAYDPINNLKDKIRKGQNVAPFKSLSVKASSKASETVINSLLKDNFKLKSNETDSELSEWTDSDEENLDDSKSRDSSDEDISQQSKISVKNNLQPPQPHSYIKSIVLGQSAEWLQENIEHSWWRSEPSSIPKVSSHPAANFFNLWQKHLSDKSMGFLKPQPTSLLSENCLLREIFWMFLNPVDCKFFVIKGNEIVMRPNVTLPSSIPSSLQNFLASLLKSITIMSRLRIECQRSYSLNGQLPHTLEAYYDSVQSLILDRTSDFILEQEAIVKAQEESYTLLTLQKRLQPYGKMLEIMWNIHETVVLDDSKYPPHICASYLLASLYRLVLGSCSKREKNLALTVFISCLKTYMDIFGIWCNEARLDDARSEFLMEKENLNDFEVIVPRLLEKSKEKSFYLNDDIAKVLAMDPTIKLLLQHSVQASFSFDIISKLDRVQDMRKVSEYSDSLYEEFLGHIEAEILKFAKSENIDQNVSKNPTEELKPANKKLVEDVRNSLSSNGDFIFMLSLESSLKQLERSSSLQANPNAAMTPGKLFDHLEDVTSYLLLPLEHCIQRILKNLLDKKVSVAEKFVKSIFMKEFHVGQHLRDIRRIFFLESSEFINFLYLKLFPLMESGDTSWSNPYFLTVAINDAVCSHGDVVFSVEVDAIDNLTALGAIGKLKIFYNVNKNICNVFTPELLSKYNEGENSENWLMQCLHLSPLLVFRFLVKIKWGLRVLNCLKFPDFFKNRIPYAKLRMIDLVIKRLCLTRFAMQHFIGSLLNRIMSFLHNVSFQLDEKVEKCKNVSELIQLHNAFGQAIYFHALLEPESSQSYETIIQILQLTDVLKKVWENVMKFAALDEQGSVDSQTLTDLNLDSLEIEKAFGVLEYHLKLGLDL